MLSTVIGGAMLPHAPQFFTMPETEDKAVVAHVREVAADIGRRLRALNPDLWIIFSNDHAEQFFHTTAPPFTIHSAAEPAVNSPGANSSGEFRVKSASSWCGSYTGRTSIQPSHRPPRSIMRSVFRSLISATPIRFCRST